MITQLAIITSSFMFAFMEDREPYECEAPEGEIDSSSCSRRISSEGFQNIMLHALAEKHRAVARHSGLDKEGICRFQENQRPGKHRTEEVFI